jgi:hypothetical protein
VRPVIVVVVFELARHGCGVSLVDDQEAVEEFAVDRADEGLGDRVCPCTGVLKISTSVAVSGTRRGGGRRDSRCRADRKPAGAADRRRKRGGRGKRLRVLVLDWTNAPYLAGQACVAARSWAAAVDEPAGGVGQLRPESR